MDDRVCMTQEIYLALLPDIAFFQGNVAVALADEIPPWNKDGGVSLAVMAPAGA
jgi:hypothetical protein